MTSAQEPLSRSLDEIRKSEAKLRQVVDTIPALVYEFECADHG